MSEIYTNPGWNIKGIMLDSARLTENYEFYENLIPRLAKWGYNTLFAHFCDDEGCSILLKNTPVLPTPGAFTVAQWKTLIELARTNGMMVIPEVECLGHTGYLTRLDQYKELREPPLEGNYWSISPTHPKSLELLKGIIEEVDQIFDSPYIHIGMDEADIGGSAASRRALEEKPKWLLFGDYLNSIHKIVSGLMKKTLCWGDHLLSEEALADVVDKNVIVCNWLYGYDYSENYEGNSRYLLEKGFSIIGCPAGVWYGTLFTPNKDNFENLYEYTQAMIRLSLEFPGKILGMAYTLWSAYRHLPAISFPAIYYGGKLFREVNTNPEDSAWLSTFVKKEFGPGEQEGKNIATALKLLLIKKRRTKHEAAMMPYDETSLILAQDNMVRYVSDIVLELAEEAKILLENNSSKVEKNKREYEQWTASSEMIIKISRLGEFYHKLSPAGQYGNGRRGQSSKEELIELHKIVDSGKEEILEALSFWKSENEKYRKCYGTRNEQKGQDTVFWEVKDSDHPLDRLELTLEFLSQI